MSLAVILAAGKSTRLAHKQLLTPTGCRTPLILQAVEFAGAIADRVVIVATSALSEALEDQLPSTLCRPRLRVLDVGQTPAAPLDSALAARWHMRGGERIVFLDSDAVYEGVTPKIAAPLGRYVLGIATAPFATKELTTARYHALHTAVTLHAKGPVEPGAYVGAGVYGFSDRDVFLASAHAAAGERALADCFANVLASPIFLNNWSPYGTEEQRARYEASRVHARSARDLPDPQSGRAASVDD